MERLVSPHHLGTLGPRLSGGYAPSREPGAKRGSSDLIPLTVPEARRLLLTLGEPPERFFFRLTWSAFRRHHQAVAKQCHAARRSRGRPSSRGIPTIQVLCADNLDLTDAGWERVRPLLPPQKPLTGRPAADHRTILSGMLWVARTGSSWRELPEHFGPWQTIRSRYERWRKAGIWQRVVETLQQPPAADD